MRIHSISRSSFFVGKNRPDLINFEWIFVLPHSEGDFSIRSREIIVSSENEILKLTFYIVTFNLHMK